MKLNCKNNEKWCEDKNMCILKKKYKMECICGLGEEECNKSTKCKWCAGLVKGYKKDNKNCVPKGKYDKLCKEFDDGGDEYNSYNAEMRIREIDKIINSVTSPKEKSELLDERTELQKKRDNLKIDQIEDSARTENQTKNCMNSDLGSEYEKYGCDLKKHYKKCIKEYNKNNCMLYTSTGDFVYPSLDTAVSGKDENGYSCPSNFKCENEVSSGGFGCL